MKIHPAILTLATGLVLILPAARHTAHPPAQRLPENPEHVTLSPSPATLPGWKEISLGVPDAGAAQTQWSPDNELPPEFSTGPALTRAHGMGDMAFSPAPAPQQRQARRKDGLLSPDKSDRTAEATPGGIAPRETPGWLAEGMRELDTSRQRRDASVSTRNSRDNSPWRLSDPSRELDRSVSTDPGYDIQGDAFAPFEASAPSRSTRRR